VGQGPASAASNSITTPLPAIGAAFGGGFYAGQISTTANSVATHNLVVGPRSSAQSFLNWKTSRTATAGTSSLIDGPGNSAAMNNASHPAAQFCEGLTIGGFSDWYMPAFNELEICYYNLKPIVINNNTATGTNINAVPRRDSGYNFATPAQTSAAAFQSGGAESFFTQEYWNSTERDNDSAWSRTFENGAQGSRYKTSYVFVRAIRRIPV
jgi:hypothetical protein